MNHAQFWGGTAPSYSIERSIRFNDGDTAWLRKNDYGTPDSTKIFTFSAWIKRGELGDWFTIAGSQSGNNAFTTFGIDTSDRLVWRIRNSSSSDLTRIESTARLRDPSAWYHVHLQRNSTLGTAADRAKLYINGVKLTEFDTNNTDELNRTYSSDFLYDINVGRFQVNGSTYKYTDGYLTEWYYIDGQALDPSHFTETDPATGQLIPKKYTGTFGTNGAYLNFSDNSSSSALGTDSSGNGNDFTPTDVYVNNTSPHLNDSLEDTPTNNCCVLNELDTDPARTSTIGLANANMDASVSTYSGVQYVFRAATFASNGKDYFEVRKGDSTNKRVYIGFLEENGVRSGAGNGGIPIDFYGYGSGDTASANTGLMVNDGTFSATGLPAVDPGTLGDIIMVCHDRDNKKIWFGKNGTWFTTGGTVGNPATGTAPAITYTTDKELLPCIGAGSFASTTIRNLNFGQRPFNYTPPTGFKALNTTNLPVPTIKNGTDYFNTVLFSGNGSAGSVTGVGFQPDFIWAKNRTNAYGHELWDAIRGVNSTLFSQSTAVEDTTANRLVSFDSDGFSYGTSSNLYVNSTNSVAWNWKAGGNGSANTDGTISSTVSVNADAGFSIVKYTGNGTDAGSNTVTVGHGLGKKPDFIITKKTSSGTDYGWSCWHKDLGAGYGIWLHLTNARNPAMWDGDGNHSSTVFSPADSAYNNVNGSDYINYVFTSVEGYSKFGSYTGNGNADGTFVYTGFKPAFVLVKSSTTSEPWVIMDDERPGYNPTSKGIYANSSDAENDASGRYKDFLSNGFKARGTSGEQNSNNVTYIYMAFAEAPFKYANAR